ncbi:MAG: hypothetical protein Q8P20_01185 [bacterium]|nr:hypothetical protein [bacterium]
MKIKIENCKKESIEIDSLCELDIVKGVCKDYFCQYHCDCNYIEQMSQINFLSLFE